MPIDDAAVLPNFGKDATQSISFDTPRRSLRAAHIERIQDLLPNPRLRLLHVVKFGGPRVWKPLYQVGPYTMDHARQNWLAWKQRQSYT